jgi:hypothetical protein
LLILIFDGEKLTRKYIRDRLGTILEI